MNSWYHNLSNYIVICSIPTGLKGSELSLLIDSYRNVILSILTRFEGSEFITIIDYILIFTNLAGLEGSGISHSLNLLNDSQHSDRCRGLSRYLSYHNRLMNAVISSFLTAHGNLSYHDWLIHILMFSIPTGPEGSESSQLNDIMIWDNFQHLTGHEGSDNWLIYTLMFSIPTSLEGTELSRLTHLKESLIL